MLKKVYKIKKNYTFKKIQCSIHVLFKKIPLSTPRLKTTRPPFFSQIQSLKTTCTILILKVSHLLHIYNKGEKEFTFQIYLFYGERTNNG